MTRKAWWRAAAVTGVAAVTVGAVMVVTPPAGAVGPLNPWDPAEGFGVFVSGDAHLTSNENEGTIAIGGDLTLGGDYELDNRGEASYVAPGDTEPSALVVGGRVDYAGSADGVRLQVLGGAYAKVGDLSDAFVRDTDDNDAPADTRVLPADDYDVSPRVELTTRQAPDSVGRDSGLDFADAFSQFQDISAELAGCDGTVEMRTANGDPWAGESSAHIDLTPGITNVLNIDAADLDLIDELAFNDPPAPDTPLLINVMVDGEYDWTPPTFAGIGPGEGRYILINFPDATELNLLPGGGNTIGTIYAPGAELTDRTGSNIDGGVVAASLDHDSGEIHPELFEAELECNGYPQPTPTATVSPSVSPTPSVSPSTSPLPPVSPSTSPLPSVSPSVSPSASPSPTVLPTPPSPPPAPAPSDSPEPSTVPIAAHEPPAHAPSPALALPLTGGGLAALIGIGGLALLAGLALLVASRVRTRRADP